MFKYHTLSDPISQKWRVWLKDRFIDDVSPENAFCEFECEKSKPGLWETCKRRLAYLELGKANSGNKSPTKAEWPAANAAFAHLGERDLDGGT